MCDCVHVRMCLCSPVVSVVFIIFVSHITTIYRRRELSAQFYGVSTNVSCQKHVISSSQGSTKLYPVVLRTASAVVYSNCQFSTFSACLTFRSFWWPFAGKELSSWLSAYSVFILCRPNWMYSFSRLVSVAGCGIRLYC